MIITINRFAVGTPTGTFSALSIDGVFFCFALEPIKPLIPEGTWQIELVNSPTHTPKYGLMPWINWSMAASYNDKVNDGCHTLIHVGNTIDDTVGCVLPGALNMYSERTPPEFAGVYKSKPNFIELQKRIISAMPKGVVCEVRQ